MIQSSFELEQRIKLMSVTRNMYEPVLRTMLLSFYHALISIFYQQTKASCSYIKIIFENIDIKA